MLLNCLKDYANSGETKDDTIPADATPDEKALIIALKKEYQENISTVALAVTIYKEQGALLETLCKRLMELAKTDPDAKALVDRYQIKPPAKH